MEKSANNLRNTVPGGWKSALNLGHVYARGVEICP